MGTDYSTVGVTRRYRPTLGAYSKHVSYFGIYYRANKLLVGGMGPFGDRIT